MPVLDNTARRLSDELRERTQPGAQVDVASEHFTLYGYTGLRQAIKDLSRLRFIYTKPALTAEDARLSDATLFGNREERRSNSALCQRYLSRQCLSWIADHATFRSPQSSPPEAENTFLIAGAPGHRTAYSPLAALSGTALGTAPSSRRLKRVTITEGAEAEAFERDFEELWNDATTLTDVTRQVTAALQLAVQDNSPESIYYLALQHIFGDYLRELDDDTLPNEATGFRQSAIWTQLYDFQRDAALSIVHKLERYNGCILADSVGLGKTYTALAVIKYYELRNKVVLVLCPKKLGQNWTKYRQNQTDNPIARDRLNYAVLYHSDLLRTSGYTNGVDLSTYNWENVDLLVIDESHNFRNGGVGDALEERGAEGTEVQSHKKTRYSELLRRLRAGVRTKVLMLSATPVNNRFLDLQNQLKLAYAGEPESLEAQLPGSWGVDETFRRTQKAYNRWCRNPNLAQHSTAALMQSLPREFFGLLDAVTIARSRRHITQYYNLQAIGRFPTRRRPIARQAPLTDLSGVIRFADIAEALLTIQHAAYTPCNYILDSRRELYPQLETGYRNIGVEGREQGLVVLMRTNMLKRLESSIAAFRSTLTKVIGNIDRLLLELKQTRTSDHYVTVRTIGAEGTSSSAEGSPDAALEEALEEGEAASETKVTRLRIVDVDVTRWRSDLNSDRNTLQRLVDGIAPITAEHDTKLRMLEQSIEHKLMHPINAGNRKLVVFTAFTDTATYLYEQLSGRLLSGQGIYTAMVGGNTTRNNHTAVGNQGTFNSLLAQFSPQSHNKPASEGKFDLLIATDCISEGQNLQDADWLVNYDIHWNPVRLIQRYGRIDRLGSHNAEIQLENFWPDMELDAYIALTGRVHDRMKAVNLTGAGDSNIIAPGEAPELTYRNEQIKAQLTELRHKSLDMEELSDQVSLTDLGLDEYRVSLHGYLREHPELSSLPPSLFAVVEHTEELPSGALFVLRESQEAGKPSSAEGNRLYPYYIVYVRTSGELVEGVTTPSAERGMLELLRRMCQGGATCDNGLCREFDRLTREGSEMEHYEQLLRSAVGHVSALQEEREVESLFTEGETTALRGQSGGAEEYDLVCYVAVL